MIARLVSLVLFALALAPVQAPAQHEDTIKSLEKKTYEVKPGGLIIDSTDRARESYRSFLDLISADPELRAEAMRRLGDLELEAMEAQAGASGDDGQNAAAYSGAVTLFQQLLEAYPEYRRNDTVLYQLARAYEIGGQTDDALRVLNELIARYPATELLDEVQFRRGEMLFLRKDYDSAEEAYRQVVAFGDESRYYEQSLYKLAWSQFKLAKHEESLDPFFGLLDRRIGGIKLKDGDERLDELSRAERELVEDTFRVLSISFSYMDGAESIDDYLAKRGHPHYGYVIYMNLGDLYLDKERYVDAAETYEAFVRQDPDHAKAPLLQVEVIEAYKQGGFPTLVLDAKKSYVDRYGMDRPFWLLNPPEENTAVAAHLKANLTDLAQYYHAEAQANGKREDYQEAARWYRKFLDYFPGEPDSANTNFLLAEILFESQDYYEATLEYERTAYDYAVHPRSSEAGYAAILAYREHEQRLEGSARAAWHQRYLDSGLRFADTYPEHPESGAVLTTVAEDLFAQNQFDLAIAVGQTVVAKQPPVDPELARTAWTVIAHSQFDLQNYPEAENAYYRLRTFVPAEETEAQQEIKDRIASSIYKQGELARDAGFLDAAVAHFMRLGQAVPDSNIRATAEYDAAAALITMGEWGRASGVLEDFRRNYPDSEFADDVTAKLAVTYLESGRGAEAAAEFESIADAATSTDEVRRDALWKAAELYKDSAKAGDEERVLRNIVARYPNPIVESIEARNRLAELAEARNDGQARVAQLQDIVRVDATAGAQRSDRTRYLAAKASLELAEPVRRNFAVLKLTQPLADSMKLKRAAMEDVLKAYGDAAAYGVAEVTTAATFRLAEVYQQMGRDVMDSERPAELDQDALEEYEFLIEEQAFPFEEKAIELFQANTDRAADGVYDEWVQKSFDELAELMPARYAKLERSEDVVTALY
ncbi:MAG: tetratricopeptide repeat protein [Gammaproteobacteria bacterium]|nr:tetratricopeptide repeat protein [Gammaproteobacteria bacterium]MDH4254687.1 tetratricopeptide repeat protein [Gammaproteobacteria bacterium]MDH5308790.1 tetratricopeptide repeat protein [Gammaproteobacteria bacterium]